MSTTETSVTWLTQEAHDRLAAELESLIQNRPVIAAEINARREEGDLRENGGYHAAKDEQGKQEARIHQLEELLRNSAVGEAPTDVSEVRPGVVVTVRFDDGDTETFLLGSREIAATTDVTVYSPESALGAAIMGRRAQETVSYETPSGATLKVTIVEITPFAP